ncbi:LamG-like jellyroll fold domain-containing protein [Parafrankia discariae]|uniref:LamG-like jellyroll fold domain-containing protein n=1 Tax=Parafrankia discariae TaxID=365528 RepID=UPI00039DFAAE|nr:LamG-like jellyroll fold domain-containing protein [Parafrankia discariae]
MSADLLLHWPLDDIDDDGAAPDASGAGRDAATDGPVTAAPDERFGSCLRVAPGGAVLRSADDPALRAGAYTFSVWVDLDQPKAGSPARVVGGRTGGPALAVTPAGAVVHLPAGGPPDQPGGLVSPDGAIDFTGWHHVALTDDGLLTRTYVDGVEVARQVSSGAGAVGGGLVLGCAPAGPDGGTLVLDIGGGALAAGPIVSAAAASPASDSQLWTLTDDGYVRNRVNPDLVLDVWGAVYTAGTAVHAHPRNGGNNQRWTLTADGYLQSQADPTAVLDATGQGGVVGAPCVIWWRNDPLTPHQMFARDADGRIHSRAVAGTGRFAHLRLYDGALDADELGRDMADDESALAAFVRTHPLTVELTDTDGQPVLYIEDGPPSQRLTLRVTNAGRQDVELRAVSGSEHHLALAFRPGTLAAGATPTLTAAGWTLTRDADTLYLKAQAATTLARGAWIDLPLTGLGADGAGGTHGTRVEVGFGHLGYAGEVQELTGSRLLLLDVVNHRGRPDIPLHAAFVGGNRVLSDGLTPGSLTIRLSTVSRDAGLALAGAASAGDAASAFVVSFEGSEDRESREWALTDAGKAGEVTLAVADPDGAEWLRGSNDLGQSRSWTLTPAQDTVIQPGTAVELTLDSVYALPTAGQASVVVAYRNVPGYQDGFVALTVERSPLLFSAAAVGIGAPAAGPTLTVGAAEQHLQLRRPTDTSGRGNRLFLELLQDDTGSTTALTYPSIRLGHACNYAQRIEARADGIYLKGGDLAGDGLIDLFARTATVSGLRAGTVAADALHVGGTPAGSTTAAKASVLAQSEHLQLRRETATPGTGAQVYLELFQDRTSGAQVTYPSIRFHHADRFWHRIEGRPEGIAFKEGNLAGNGMIDIFAGTAKVNGLQVAATAQADVLRVGGTPSDNQLTGRATVSADNSHVQLRRESGAGGTGAQLFLELFQDTTAADRTTYPTIRFHHTGKFWNQVEGRPEGIFIRWSGGDAFTDLYAATAVLQGLKIGSVTIGENELRILQALAAGNLRFQLLNTAQNEYAYAADYKPFDNDRRHVFTWRHKGEQVAQGEWQIVGPK